MIKRAYGTVLRPSTSVCDVMYLAKQCRAHVTTDSLQEVYDISIGTKMNDLDLCLEVV